MTAWNATSRWKAALTAGLVLVGAACASRTDAGTERLGASPVPALTPLAGHPGSPCVLPPRVATPVWVPADLPFPAGSYVTRELSVMDLYQAHIVIPTDQVTLARFLLERWPAAGYVLVDGDAEPGKEIDQEAANGAAGVALKAQVVGCNPGYQDGFLSYRAPP
jgi:hypothetical protein